jgi:hypothetical protein
VINDNATNKYLTDMTIPSAYGYCVDGLPVKANSTAA